MNKVNPNDLLQLIKLKEKIQSPEYKDLKTLLYNNLFNKIPAISVKIPKGDFLFRTVPIFRSDITLGRKKYLSYRPKEINYPFFNRCSEPEQRHFYCSTTRHLSIAECSYFISESENKNASFSKESELLEVGMWEVMRDMYVADLRYGNFVHHGNEEFQTDLKVKYNEFNKEPFVNDFFNHINELFEIPIRKIDHLCYWLTACYSNYIFDDEFKPETSWGTMEELDGKPPMLIDGILYHSVKGIKADPPIDGYNLALRTAIVDSADIRLIRAGIFETNRVGEWEFNLDKLIKINKAIVGNSWYYDDPTEKELV